MQLLQTIGVINFTLLLASLLWNSARGTLVGGGFANAAGTIIMLMIGFNIATLLPAPETTRAGYTMCSVVIEGAWWNCSGWAIFTKENVDSAQTFATLIGPGGQIPAAMAAFLGSWYIHTRLLKGLTFDYRDIARAFSGGFLIYASLAFMPTISGWMNEIVTNLVSFLAKNGSGEATLKGWLETIRVYKEYAANEGSSINIGIWVLRAAVVIPLWMFSNLNYFLLIFQSIVMAFIPLSVFLATLKRSADPTIAISILGNYALLSAVQALQWLLLSTLPSMQPPGNIANFDVWPVVAKALPAMAIFGVIGFFLMKVTLKFVVMPTMEKLLNPRIIS